MYLRKIYAYNARINAWSYLPDSSFEGYALAIVDGLLILIGRIGNGVTNQLFSLHRNKRIKWTKKFPPMPTKQYGVCALNVIVSNQLIVVGGFTSGNFTNITDSVKNMASSY